MRRPEIHRAWGLVAVLALGFPVAAQQGEILDRVVAVIDGTVLTQSELDFETRVLLVERGGVQAESAALGADTLREALELVISQRLQILDADRLQAFSVETADVDRRVEGLKDRLGGQASLDAFLERQDADLEQLQRVLERSVRAERILDGRIRLRAQVSESEVRRYYDAHARQLSGSYESVKAALQQKLTRERYNQLAAEELAQVRRAAQVRFVAPFARETRR